MKDIPSRQWGEGFSNELHDAASKEKNPLAQALLGEAYITGNGVDEDIDRGIFWLKKSVKRGSPEGATSLAGCYYRGIGVEEDHAMAAQLYLKAADLGDAVAMLYLAESYIEGDGVPKDLKLGFLWATLAANEGLDDAQLYIGRDYLTGETKPQNYHKAVPYLQAAANQGNAEAQFLVASCHRYGFGTKEDARVFFHWAAHSAVQGNTNAQLALAEAYLNGIGTEKDERKAFLWYKRAGAYDEIAQNMVADCYAKGIGTKQDERFEHIWRTAAAKNENPVAQFSLGMSFLQRDVKTEETLRTGWDWIKRAAANKNEDARSCVDSYELRRGPEGLAFVPKVKNAPMLIAKMWKDDDACQDEFSVVLLRLNASPGRSTALIITPPQNDAEANDFDDEFYGGGPSRKNSGESDVHMRRNRHPRPRRPARVLSNCPLRHSHINRVEGPLS